MLDEEAGTCGLNTGEKWFMNNVVKYNHNLELTSAAAAERALNRCAHGHGHGIRGCDQKAEENELELKWTKKKANLIKTFPRHQSSTYHFAFVYLFDVVSEILRKKQLHTIKIES